MQLDLTGLTYSISEIHTRAIADLHLAAQAFERLGQVNMSVIYLARARDLQVQLERHLQQVRQARQGDEHGRDLAIVEHGSPSRR
jgi:hypothetical protein